MADEHEHVPSVSGEVWQRLPAPSLPLGRAPCDGRARDPKLPLRLIVLTGGPGAGKTAVLAAARANYCRHVAIVPEAATILFTGGFPRHDSVAARQAAQRAIYQVQREAERLVDDELEAHTALCDRGTVDGEAYWPDGADAYWHAVGTTHAEQLARYARVIHLRTPEAGHGYDHSNVARLEDVAEARRIDERILDAWDGHPDRVVIEATQAFEEKLHTALAAIDEALA